MFILLASSWEWKQKSVAINGCIAVSLYVSCEKEGKVTAVESMLQSVLQYPLLSKNLPQVAALLSACCYSV